ncbi:unnamed protein product, partial [Mesorhabditis spiculigera]
MKPLTFCILPLLPLAAGFRIKREFMYVNADNPSDADCFQQCNEKYVSDFGVQLQHLHRRLYDFPTPSIEHSSYLLFCKLASDKTKCYMDRCNDKTSDVVFSPSNFICDFRRKLFLEARPCLSEAEPITFLKCDQECHTALHNENSIRNNSLFRVEEVDGYEDALSTLCTFQSCYLDCALPVITEVCKADGAKLAADLLTTFVHWHANDIYEWHVVSDRLPTLPASCSRLADHKPEKTTEIQQAVKL